jgi:hypothetical protein
VHEIVFGNEFAVGADQHLQDVEGASAQRHRCCFGAQFAAAEVDFALSARIDQSWTLRRHAPPSISGIFRIGQNRCARKRGFGRMSEVNRPFCKARAFLAGVF